MWKNLLPAAVGAIGLLAGGIAEAQVTGVHVEHVRPDSLPGYVVNRLKIDFVGRWTGAQAWSELLTGNMFHDADWGADTAPNSALVAAFPDVQWDSFVTMGGWTSQESDSAPLLVGAATHLLGPADRYFDERGINLSWAAPPIDYPVDRSDYPLAQLTLSDDATGTLHLDFTANGQGFEASLPIVSGAIGIPEPATVSIMLIAAGLSVLSQIPGRRTGSPCPRARVYSTLGERRQQLPVAALKQVDTAHAPP